MKEPSPQTHLFTLASNWASPIDPALLLNFEKHNLTHRTTKKLTPELIELNQAVFNIESTLQSFPVTVIQQEQQLRLYCECLREDGELCEHQAKVLWALMKQEELQVFFNPELRGMKLKEFARDFGMENEPDLDQHFKIELEHKNLKITPLQSGLIPVTKDSLKVLQETFVAGPQFPAGTTSPADNQQSFVVLRQHKYYKYLRVELYQSERTKEGKIKNPVNALDPEQFVWKASDPNEMKFFMGINRVQSNLEEKVTEADLTALQAIVKNPLDYPFYYHNPEVSEKITASSVIPIGVKMLGDGLKLVLSKTENAYELSAVVKVDDWSYSLSDVSFKYNCFLLIGDTLYLIEQLPVLKCINLLKQNSDKLLIHSSKFEEFRSAFLNKIEDSIEVEYRYIKEATPKQLKENHFDWDMERLIYLSDFGEYVMIIPVMRYSDVEISVRSRRQVYGRDQQGKEFLVKRNEKEETEFIALLIKQHPDFPEQLENPLHYFYLHKKHFLKEEWFLKAFEEWGQHDISILGFNEIEGNKVNPNRAKVDIKVESGINWFNAKVEVKYGGKKAPVKKLHTAIRNKGKYVVLDDGTHGIIPEEWIEKFSEYFNAGEVTDDETISIPKVNFSAVESLFDAAMLDGPVMEEIRHYQEKVNDFTSIQEVKVPTDLKGTLRTYQKEGLNWLSFLDDFNFGGVLADDMGLGKSIQIIAFLLLQREKAVQNLNLLVVPTTLIFNWKAEIEKFAPSLKVHVLQGADRRKSTSHFNDFEIILTSYNILLSDISYLKNYTFNYVILDESQQIKNPQSQRYKAARLLKSRNKLAVTGTPVENNTFDLYSQFTFACPGLFGSRQHFKRLYSVPIDQFKDRKRAGELQQKIKPFLLRRTKQQVAQELPDKTELVLYCEMEEEQRNIYKAYEKEFREYISATKDEEILKNPMHALRGLTVLRQICNSPKLLNSEALAGEGNSSKIEMLMEQIEDHSPHHKMLVFSQFVSMLDLIKEELVKRDIPFCILTGSTRNREAVVNNFQSNDEIRVFLISLKAGGTGLNLVEADYVYLVDPWWNPAVENQAIDRSHRIGQDKKVTAIRLICPGTVEEKMMQLQESKRELTGKLIQEESGFLAGLGKGELLGLLG